FAGTGIPELLGDHDAEEARLLTEGDRAKVAALKFEETHGIVDDKEDAAYQVLETLDPKDTQAFLDELRRRHGGDLDEALGHLDGAERDAARALIAEKELEAKAQATGDKAEAEKLAKLAAEKKL